MEQMRQNENSEASTKEQATAEYLQAVDEMLALSEKLSKAREEFEAQYLQPVYEFKELPANLSEEQKAALEAESTEFRTGRQAAAKALLDLSTELSQKATEIKERGKTR